MFLRNTSKSEEQWAGPQSEPVRGQSQESVEIESEIHSSRARERSEVVKASPKFITGAILCSLQA